jgi:hypothetical protein
MCFARIRAARQTRVQVAAIALACIGSPSTLWAEQAAVFVADHQRLHHIDPATNTITRSATLTSEPEALVPSPNGGVWVLAGKRLLRYSATLAYEHEIDLSRAAAGFEGGKQLVANPYDGSVWLRGEKTVVRLGTDGAVRTSWQATDDVKAIVLDPDETLWVLAKKQLWRLGKDTSVLQTFGTAGAIKEPELLAVDRLGNRLWLSNGEELVAVSMDRMQSLVRINLKALPASAYSDDDSRKAKALAAHPIFGTVWVVTKTALVLLDRDGGFLKKVDLAGHDLGEIEAVAFDAANFGLWIGGKKAVAQFQSNGDFVARTPIPNELEAIAASGFKLLPTLALLTPPDGLITNNAFTPLRYRLGADCTDTPCVLDSGYPLSLHLEADANGQVLGPYFTRTPYEASFTPTTRWPEGLNRLNAQATDLYGHRSDRLMSSFTIDTIPPKFLLVEPPDGSSARSSSVTISGSVDDATANVALYDESGRILSSAAANFSFAVILKPGLNAFVLTVRDPAGNETSMPLRIANSPLNVKIVSPVMNATLPSGHTVVRGTFDGTANTGVTVNGAVATVVGKEFFANIGGLQRGTNVLTATATTSDGTTASDAISVSVTDAGSELVTVVSSTTGGVAPLLVTFNAITAGIDGISEIVVDTGASAECSRGGDGDVVGGTHIHGGPADGSSGNCIVSVADPSGGIRLIYYQPGYYHVVVTVTDTRGVTRTFRFVVVVQDRGEVDLTLQSVFDEMRNRLKVGDIDGALENISGGAQERYKVIFTALRPALSSVAARLGSLSGGTIVGDIAEFVVLRDGVSGSNAFLVYFLRGEDGVWRLDSM